MFAQGRKSALYGKTRSVVATSRKSALWMRSVPRRDPPLTEKRTLRATTLRATTLRATTLRVAIARVAAPRATALDVAATELRRTTSDYEAC